MTHVEHSQSPAHADSRPTGWRRWVYSTNHRDIGTMYIVLSISAGLVGSFISVVMRAELAQPGLQVFIDPQFYNVMVSAHGLIMIFFVLMPALIGGFGNWFVPRSEEHTSELQSLMRISYAV